MIRHIKTKHVFNPISQVIDYLNKHLPPLVMEESKPITFFDNKSPNCYTRTIIDEFRENLRHA